MSFSKEFNALANKYFDGHKDELHGWIIDTFNNDDIGTGKYLDGQPQFDIKNQENKPELKHCVADEKLSVKALKENPNKWFVYSEANAIAKPLTTKDFEAIKNAVIYNKGLYYDLVPNEACAEKQLKALTA